MGGGRGSEDELGSKAEKLSILLGRNEMGPGII